MFLMLHPRLTSVLSPLLLLSSLPWPIPALPLPAPTTTAMHYLHKFGYMETETNSSLPSALRQGSVHRSQHTLVDTCGMGWVMGWLVVSDTNETEKMSNSKFQRKNCQMF